MQSLLVNADLPNPKLHREKAVDGKRFEFPYLEPSWTLYISNHLSVVQSLSLDILRLLMRSQGLFPVPGLCGMGQCTSTEWNSFLPQKMGPCSNSLWQSLTNNLAGIQVLSSWVLGGMRQEFTRMSNTSSENTEKFRTLLESRPLSLAYYCLNL